jgi:hypothetical protein
MCGQELEDGADEKAPLIRQCLRAGPEGHTRRDTVLVDCPERHSRLSGSLSHRRVAQVIIFFTCKAEAMSDLLGFAYVNWFQTMAKDERTGMYQLRRTRTYGVVDVAQIVRAVHLIPRYHTFARTDTQVRNAVWRDLHSIVIMETGQSGFRTRSRRRVSPLQRAYSRTC